MTAVAPERRASVGDVAPAFGVYAHVPFCSALCPYCDFAVVVGRADVHDAYCEAIAAEAEARAGDVPSPAGTLFVGGGTPTAVRADVLARMIGRVRAAFAVRDDAEVTVEANPESVEVDGLREVRLAGVNRISIGAQSFDDPVLRALGRTHDAGAIRAAVEAARAAGFENVSLDLIYGAPGQSVKRWRASVEAAVALRVEHVSCYALTIEEPTAFGRAVARGSMSEPDQDGLAARFEVACDVLEGAGFEHYEISNWARAGCESRHNLVYWTQGEYAGLGLGAHSHRDGVRSWNTRALRAYLDAPATAVDGEETLDAAARAEEWVSLRMRLVEGLDLAEASARLGQDLEAAARACEALGLATIAGSRLRLTTRGMLLENDVTGRLLAGPA